MFNTQQFAETNKATVDQFFANSNNAFQGVEQLATLNLQVAKTVMAEIAENTQAALSAGSPEDLYKLQASVFQTAPEKFAAYANQVKAIVEASFASQRAAVETNVAAAQAQYIATVAGLLKDAPGSDNAIALVKSAVAASNNAYEGVNKASKQVTEAVETNVAKFTTAANKARKVVAA